jgi:uncharacterized membrane protein (UPF0127 family)
MLPATTVLRTPLQRARGVIGREPSRGEQYMLTWDDVGQRRVHMVGVRRPLRVRWLADGDLVAEETLPPWVGSARHRADVVIETAAGNG